MIRPLSLKEFCAICYAANLSPADVIADAQLGRTHLDILERFIQLTGVPMPTSKWRKLRAFTDEDACRVLREICKAVGPTGRAS